ncbi:uncharacterized protein LOC128224608 isoform X2 [Mya arenaria]|uniref:uncharacterized protein LOC128224608 isoform X2 n=1 Tax=Mya arenaria TaxID=6604 RepID=UPI0022DFB818|nr:uncharacterized protein LOC128224608 isoform X2 [Mya arenaria]
MQCGQSFMFNIIVLWTTAIEGIEPFSSVRNHHRQTRVQLSSWTPKGNPHGLGKWQPSSWCQCHLTGCACCEDSLASLKNRKFHLNACLTVDWNSATDAYSVVLSVNGRTLYHTNTKMPSSTMETCVPATRMNAKGEICFRFYNFDQGTGNLCASLEAEIEIENLKEIISINYGCFRIGARPREQIRIESREWSTDFRAIYERRQIKTIAARKEEKKI